MLAKIDGWTWGMCQSLCARATQFILRLIFFYQQTFHGSWSCTHDDYGLFVIHVGRGTKDWILKILFQTLYFFVKHVLFAFHTVQLNGTLWLTRDWYWKLWIYSLIVRLFKIDKFVISCSFYLWVGF